MGRTRRLRKFRLAVHAFRHPARASGAWRKVPGWLANPMGPLAVRWRYLPKAVPWLLRYLAAGWTEARVQRTATALRMLLADAPALHRRLAAEVGVPHLIEQRGLLHMYRSRQEKAKHSHGGCARARGSLGRMLTRCCATNPISIRATRSASSSVKRGTAVTRVSMSLRWRGTHDRLVRWSCARTTGFRADAGRLRAVLTDNGEIDCDMAAICAGARSAELAACVGSHVPLESERGYHV